MKKNKFEPLSALSVQMGMQTYANEVTEKFLSHLDLTACRELYEKLTAKCNWFEEAFINEKFFIKDYINRRLENSTGEHLILIPAAGKSPLALELLLNHNSKIDRIVEIDLHFMEEKKEIYDKYFPEVSSKIKCITADITSLAILSMLNGLLHEYYSAHPTIVILEGITYYISPADLENIIAGLRSVEQKNTLIVEYLLPTEKINEERRSIPNDFYGFVKNTTGLKSLTHYSVDTLTPIFEKNGGSLMNVATMDIVERSRLGENKYFNSSGDSWIECAVWRI